MQDLPAQLLKSLRQLDHFSEAAFIQAHSEENKITSIRLNPFKKAKPDFNLGEAVKWNSQGYYLPERPSFTLDPLFQAGCYYPQEAGSMFLEFALKQTLDFSQSLKILDVCAAPGGKSTLINSLLNQESLLVANEIIKSRAEVLTENLSKWGTSNTIVTNNEPQRFTELSAFFDAVVIDAPCSGSGLFRKQPEAVEEWSEEHVKSCGLRQQKILTDVLPSLKVGGILIYSTCSYSVTENEEIVKTLITEWDMEYLPLAIDQDWGIVETPFGYRFYPHLTKSEGFFCAALRKRSGPESSGFSKKKKLTSVTRTEQTLISPFVIQGQDEILKINQNYHQLSPAVAEFLSLFEQRFYFKKAGVVIGEIKGRDLVPNQELAWFINLNPTLERADLNREVAIKFLKKEKFELEKNINGLNLMCYKQYGLGWAKILPNRVNNYLPNALRILK